jgi:hypothetical protein
MRARFIRALTLFLLLMFSAGSESFSQENALRPLRWDQVIQLWQEESANRLPKNRTRELVNERGVDFMLDPQREMELSRRNFSIDFINDIRRQIKTATLTIKCEPVDCSVRINGESAGTTLGFELSRSVFAGPLTIDVSAPNLQSLTDTVEFTPGRNITRSFLMKPLQGGLVVDCVPTDCLLRINGISTGTLAQRRWELKGLVSGEYDVEVRAEGYKSAKGRFRVNAPDTSFAALRMDVDEWSGVTALHLFERMVQAIGNELLLKAATISKSSGRMTLEGDPSGIGNWKAQLIEITMPGKQRWDLQIAGRSWTVAVDGTTVKSKGDKRYAGTAFGQELEKSIRQFSSLRLPSILPVIKSGFLLSKEGNEIQPRLVAESDMDRYTFTLSEAYIPLRLLHEHLSVPRSREEMEFGRYRRTQSGLKLPHVMILRYPDRPKLEQMLEFDNIDPTIVLKESNFKP